MKSVADELRKRDREAILKLTVEERMELAFKLGEEDLALFCQHQGVDPRTGTRLLQRRRQAGRRPSKCMSDLIGLACSLVSALTTPKLRALERRGLGGEDVGPSGASSRPKP